MAGRWSTTRDAVEFLAAAGDLLAERPVANTVLLTEAAYLRRFPSGEQLFGWWPGGGAFLLAPGHPAVLSDLPDAAIEALPRFSTVDVDARLAGRLPPSWRERSRVTLHRLGDFRPGPAPPGRPRTATPDDRDLLVSWFHRLMAAHPDDPSDLAYVVDDPLTHGGITLWEAGGAPVAMAGCSRTIAGMVRLGAVYAPEDDAYGAAAFTAACATARRTARDVLVFAPAGDDAPAYRRLGFRPVLDRVQLTLSPSSDEP